MAAGISALGWASPPRPPPAAPRHGLPLSRRPGRAALHVQDGALFVPLPSHAEALGSFCGRPASGPPRTQGTNPNKTTPCLYGGGPALPKPGGRLSRGPTPPPASGGQENTQDRHLHGQTAMHRLQRPRCLLGGWQHIPKINAPAVGSLFKPEPNSFCGARRPPPPGAGGGNESPAPPHLWGNRFSPARLIPCEGRLSGFYLCSRTSPGRHG